MRRILKLAGSKTAEEMKNQVEFLSAWWFVLAVKLHLTAFNLK